MTDEGHPGAPAPPPVAVHDRRSPTVASTPVVLDARHLSRRFGDVHALRAVDLEVRAGEVVGLLGPNGAGKTTLVRTVATLLEPDRGTVSVCGHDTIRDPRGARAHLGLAGQFASVDELLTGRENLELIGRLYGIAADDCRVRAASLLVALGLDDAADRRAGAYSGGMRRRLDLGATLIGEPSLLLLDEPTAGLDPRSRLAVWELIDAIADRGTTVFLTSQDLNEVERLAQRVVVIDHGAIVADAEPRSLQRQIGGRVIEIGFDPTTSRDDGSLQTAVRVLTAMGLDPQLDQARQRITAPTTGALASAVVAAQGLIDAHVEPAELALRAPSLEEAFLALTGSRADGDEREPDPDPDPVPSDPLPERDRPVLTRSTRRDVATITRRYWKHLVRTPESVFFACVQPVLFVLGLAAVFGGLVEHSLGDSYIQFLLPGVLVMQVALAAGTTGVGLATDLGTGIIDRFRSLPMAPVAVLVGRTTTDLVRNAVAVTVMIATGYAIGFRLEGSLASGFAALAVALLFGYAITWLFASVGLAVRDPQAANFIGFAPVLIFVYLSSAWVPIETMSPAVQGFARHQPVNVTVEAVRSLAGGTPDAAPITQSLAWSIGLIVVFGAITARQFRRSTS